IAARQPTLNQSYKQAALSLGLLLLGFYSFALIWSDNVSISLVNILPALVYWLAFAIAASFIYGRLGYLMNKSWWPISVLGLTFAVEALTKISPTVHSLWQDPTYSVAWL